MVCTGECAVTYDGHIGIVLRKVKSDPSDKQFLIHLRELNGNIHICSDKMIQECSGNPDYLISALKNLIDEIDVLRKESIEQVDTIIALEKLNNTYYGYLYDNKIEQQ